MTTFVRVNCNPCVYIWKTYPPPHIGRNKLKITEQNEETMQSVSPLKSWLYQVGIIYQGNQPHIKQTASRIKFNINQRHECVHVIANE